MDILSNQTALLYAIQLVLAFMPVPSASQHRLLLLFLFFFFYFFFFFSCSFFNNTPRFVNQDLHGPHCNPRRRTVYTSICKSHPHRLLFILEWETGHASLLLLPRRVNRQLPRGTSLLPIKRAHFTNLEETKFDSVLHSPGEFCPSAKVGLTLPFISNP